MAVLAAYLREPTLIGGQDASAVDFGGSRYRPLVNHGSAGRRRLSGSTTLSRVTGGLGRFPLLEPDDENERALLMSVAGAGSHGSWGATGSRRMSDPVDSMFVSSIP